MVESAAGSRLLVDTSTDLRQQLLANNIHRLDAVFWTHDHADHCHGIDDLRPFRYGRAGPLPGFANDETVRRLRNRFGYVFAGQHGYHTLVELEGLTGSACSRALALAGARCPMAQRKAPLSASTAMASPSDMQLILVQLPARWSACSMVWTCWSPTA
jgi:hypothetical protein